ncbi:MAG: DUF4445 domain-containing protein [Verrucomicrobia bacterium]|nr:DUF4445 domain-containing protein [Verrucomicrobiota bacterium]
MKQNEIKVTFEPSGRSVYALPGTPLVEAAGRAGIILQMPCGGQGTCGKCKVQITSKSEPSLACQTRVEQEMVVNVPVESRFEASQRILVADSGEQGAVAPVLQKIAFTLDPPTQSDVRSDMARLYDLLGGDVKIATELIRTVPTFLRSNDWQGTAVLMEDRLIALEVGDTSQMAYGVAFDLGTTTVVGTLFDLITGAELGVASRINAQVAHGDDVISRIHKVRETPAALAELQEAVLGTVNDILKALASQAGICSSHIYEVVLAGNSTMQQILAGFDPSALGEVPFVQVFDKALVLSANRLGLRASAVAEVYLFPQVGGFVGGDTVAGMVAARLDRHDKPVLLVDIGTNGEIVLAVGDKLLSSSTAAGPAFEGARITQGMRATTGAIEKVMIGDDVTLNVIGNAKPIGLCGTALIDTVAELLTAGIIDETGRILDADEVPDRVSEALKKRLIPGEHDMNFELASAAEAGGSEPVYLWQRDVRELQLASGAIRAGINILLRRAGITSEDLGSVLLAGAFGNFIRRNHARRIGLLPPLPTDHIRFIGNAASLGAKLVLLSEDERHYATEVRHKVEHVDLSQDPEFQMEFGMAMMFPGSEADVL